MVLLFKIYRTLRKSILLSQKINIFLSKFLSINKVPDSCQIKAFFLLSALSHSFIPSNSSHDWGSSSISFTGKTISGAGRIVSLIDTSRGGVIYDVKIENNTISNLNSQDWSAELKYWRGIVIKR